MNAIFVYGLLKPGESLHHVVQPYLVRSLPATTRGRLYDAGVPAARFDEDGEIDGYLFLLEENSLDEAMRILDELEDEGESYERRVIEAATGAGVVEAFAYHYLLSVEGLTDVGRSWPG